MLDNFYEHLDRLYQAGDLKAVEQYLQNCSLQCGLPEKISALNELGGFYRGISRYQESEEAFCEAMALLEQIGQGSTARFATVLLNLAGTYRLSGHLDEAEAMLQQAIEQLDTEEYAYAGALNNLSLVKQAQGDLAEAERLSRQALDWIRGHGAPAHELATSYNNLAALCMHQQKLPQAQQMLDKAMEIYDCMQEPNVHLAAACSTQGVLCYAQRDWAGAEKAFQRALELTEHFFGQNEEYRTTLQNLALVKRKKEERT